MSTENTHLLIENRQRELGKEEERDTKTSNTNIKTILSLIINILYLCLSTYGLVVYYVVSKRKPTGVCEKELQWIYICSIFGYLSFCPLLTVTIVPKFKECAECIYGLVVVFLFSWLIYGATIFFHKTATTCPPEIHIFGYSLAIAFLSFVGVSCCCTIWMYNSIE
jgi:uncharacterized membrane protein